jgi:glycosyltransferase involved in cell wall biosynthesis
MARIVLLSGNSLCNNPRVLKSATALAQAGYETTVLGAWLDPALKAEDQRILEHVPFRYVPIFDSTLVRLPDAAVFALSRARSKAANVLHGFTGWESRYQLGPLTERLLAHAHALTADLFIAHSEPALYAARRLMKMGRRVGVDMEDWFSEDLLPAARNRRPLRLLRRLERALLATGAYASCPSWAMSQTLAAAYGSPPPAVIYNAFPLHERATIDGRRKDRRNLGRLSICWYSQTLGPGRGLEDLMAALPLLEHEVEVHLRGRAAPRMEQILRAFLPARLQQCVYFHPRAPNDELLSRIAEHDIGFAGEIKNCRSRDVTATNKMLHYLLGGLAVVASNTAGQCEVAKQAKNAVAIYESGNPSSLAKAIDLFARSPERLAHAKIAALHAAEETFCWERQAETLLRSVGRALQEPVVQRQERAA